MSVSSDHLRNMMRSSTSALGPASQSIKLMALMAFIVIYSPITLPGCSIITEQFPVQRGCHPTLGDLLPTLGNLALTFVSGMPRLRGRPRRGARWYAAASRRKRHRDFQTAITLARQRRRRAIRAAVSPPGTIVVEDPSIQLPEDFSESQLVTFPDDWNPHTRSFRSGTTPCGRTSSAPPTNAPSDPGTETCILEEEHWKDANAAKDTGAATEAGCLDNDDKQERPPSPPPFLPEQLQLIFEVRSLVEDQIFRAVSASQRLDMLYAAYSHDMPKRLCPTCAQPFAIPVRASAATDDRAKDDKASTG
jgi:hypothetical protein